MQGSTRYSSKKENLADNVQTCKVFVHRTVEWYRYVLSCKMMWIPRNGTNDGGLQYKLLYCYIAVGVCRGPGDFLGKKQSGKDGLSYLKAAKLPEDRQLLEQARAAAVDLLLEYGLEPDGWPKDLLAAMKDRNLPDLDLSEVSQLSWGSKKDAAAEEAGR